MTLVSGGCSLALCCALHTHAHKHTTTSLCVVCVVCLCGTAWRPSHVNRPRHLEGGNSWLSPASLWQFMQKLPEQATQMCYYYHITDLLLGSLGWLCDHFTLSVAVLMAINRQLGLWLAVTNLNLLFAWTLPDFLWHDSCPSFPLRQTPASHQRHCKFPLRSTFHKLSSHLVVIPNAVYGNWLLSPCGYI